MNSFYVNLQAELAEAKEELWAQTQIDGAEAGKKILLKGEPKDTDSVFVDEKGERIFQERISRPAKLVIWWGRACIYANHSHGKDAWIPCYGGRRPSEICR